MANYKVSTNNSNNNFNNVAPNKRINFSTLDESMHTSATVTRRINPKQSEGNLPRFTLLFDNPASKVLVFNPNLQPEETRYDLL